MFLELIECKDGIYFQIRYIFILWYKLILVKTILDLKERINEPTGWDTIIKMIGNVLINIHIFLYS